MCMSCRQPPAKMASTAMHRSPRKRVVPSPSISTCRKLIFNFVNSVRFQTVQKHLRLVQIEILVAGLDGQEKSVFRSQRESWHVENWMVRSRQTIQREHSKHRAKRRAQYRQLESNRNKMRPTV